MPPSRKATNSSEAVLGLGRERRIGGPGAPERPVLHEERRQQHEHRDEEDLVGEPVDPGKDHVVAADHERDQVVPERRDQHRHGHPEDHDGAVVGDERVVLGRRDDAPARHVHAREGELHAERVGEEAPDHRHEDAGEHVLHGDHLVVGGPQVLVEERLLVVRVFVRLLGSGVSDDGLSHASPSSGSSPGARRPRGTWSVRSPTPRPRAPRATGCGCARP